MKEQSRKNYVAPILTVICFKMERGFAVSNEGVLALSGAGIDFGDDYLEERQDGGYWGNNSNWF